MKFTLIRTDQKNVVHLKTRSVENFVERIKTDTKGGDVLGLRRHIKDVGRDMRYVQIYKLPVVYPSAELSRDSNGNLVMRRMNGVLLLSFSNVIGAERQSNLKQVAMAIPSTLAAFTGSSGESLKVLVCISRPDGVLPRTEDEANRLLEEAFPLVRTTYQSLLGMPADEAVPSVSAGFRMTLDPCPQFRAAPMPFVVYPAMAPTPATTTQGDQLQFDYDLYTHYENLYLQAVNKVVQMVDNADDAEGMLAGIAREMCLMGVAQEETVCHAWRHYKYRTDPPFTEEHVRAVVAAVYAETRPRHRVPSADNGVGVETRRLIDYLQNRYVFRYNTIMGYTEFRPNNTAAGDWKVVDERAVNGLSSDARLAGLNVWDRDVKRYVKSDKIREYNPILEYLWNIHGTWDGEDHIGRLAATVPCDNPEWPRWFRTWVLAMVAQWKGQNQDYGNSVVPLLISEQGYNKSTFCRSLLPRELQWGYTDNLILNEKRSVLQAMSQMLLINLDEFNQISPKTQQGFLKNIIQLAQVKAKRPYGRHIEDFPRMASFIATTNMADVLADPSGNRRFIGVELKGPIDVSVQPNHRQLYAQAQALIHRGEPFWFDECETQLIMLHNQKYEVKTTAEQFFHEMFLCGDAVRQDEGRWMSAAAIYQSLKREFGSVLNRTNIIAFGRILSNIDNLPHRRTRTGVEYLVRLRSK